jgi:hypothetical protein
MVISGISEKKQQPEIENGNIPVQPLNFILLTTIFSIKKTEKSENCSMDLFLCVVTPAYGSIALRELPWRRGRRLCLKSPGAYQLLTGVLFTKDCMKKQGLK